mmetsp:Transcript_32018/g.76496  ORF Transcript_32018/g.76496 Transcript_32018/m.76496 type:complete len:95 (+) Transcript_32018:548-832(+)
MPWRKPSWNREFGFLTPAQTLRRQTSSHLARKSRKPNSTPRRGRRGVPLLDQGKIKQRAGVFPCSDQQRKKQRGAGSGVCCDLSSPPIKGPKTS